MLEATHRSELSNPSYWDKQANAYNEDTAYMGELTQKQLNRICLLSEDTVLDVGAGTGRLTLPLAKRAKQITALEPSAAMLAILKTEAHRKHVSNVRYVNSSLEDADVATVKPHDIVLASFSLLMPDVETALLKMNDYASKNVYLFLSASKWMDEELHNMVYSDLKAHWSDFIYVYNILYSLGITANVDVFDYEHEQDYNTVDDAVAKFAALYHVERGKEDKLRTYLQRSLVEDEGKLWLNRKRKAAMIWWTKKP
jgi:ubiquinone/menaquinone biosynthesis C-methylase UbiE